MVSLMLRHERSDGDEPALPYITGEQEVTYSQLLQRCRRTLDLHPDADDVSLRDIAKVLARNYSNAHTVAALYACLWANVVEYLETSADHPPSDIDGCAK